MSLDLKLEKQEVLDHVRGRIIEPPSNATDVARKKWTRGELKETKIIRDSIDKHLVAYVSKLTTSKEIYDRLVSLFKVNDANQVLFLRNKLKVIKKGKDESMQAYFLGITEIKNDLLSIGEVVPDREMAITTLGWLPSERYIFKTTLLNNNVIPGFEELMVRCIQEETRMEEKEMHALEVISLHSPLILKGETIPGLNLKERPNRRVEEKEDVKIATKWATIQGSALIKRTHIMTMIKITPKAIKGMAGSMEKRMSEIKEVVNPPRRQETPEALSNLIEKETNLEIVLGDNSKYPMKGVGNFTLQLNQGNTIHLQEILYVPDLKKNPVSISAMEDKGYKVAFVDGKVHVWKTNFKDAFTL
eukprot:PITA_21057